MSVVSVASAGAVSLEAYDPLAIDFRSPPAELSKAQIKKLKKRRKELLENKADSELLSKLGDEDAERCMKQVCPRCSICATPSPSPPTPRIPFQFHSAASSPIFLSLA